MPSRRNEPEAIAIGLLVFGGGALLMSSLFGVWTAFASVVVTTTAISIAAEAHRRRRAQADYERQVWRRTLWEEWGSQGE